MLNFIKPTQDFETFTASLGDGEHFQKLELNSSWFIEKMKLTSNLGNVFGPYGGGGGEDRRPHRTIRKGVNPKHVYLDGVRGYVVRAQGAKALNRVSFKWSFVMDKKISRYSYHHSVVLRPDSERISVLDLVSSSYICFAVSDPTLLLQERDISLTDHDPEVGTRRDWPTRFFPPIGPAEMMDVYHWSDEDDVRSPPNILPPINPWMNVQPEVEMEEDSGESDREDEVAEAAGELQEHPGPW